MLFNFEHWGRSMGNAQQIVWDSAGSEIIKTARHGARLQRPGRFTDFVEGVCESVLKYPPEGAECSGSDLCWPRQRFC